MKKGSKGKKRLPQQSIVPFVEDIDENNPWACLFSDTICTKVVGLSSWESIYHYFEEEKPKVIERKITVEEKTLV